MKQVFSVGLALPGNPAEYVAFRSDKALFDADVVLFRPTFEEYDSYESYAGSRLIAESDSADLVRDSKHWRSELKAAADGGKVVFVMLYKPTDVYYDTGQRSHSGTGRSRQTTRHVAPKSSYDAIPITLEGLTPRGGTEIAPLANLGALAAYWAQFGSESSYEVYFDATGVSPILGTRNREKVVGAIARTKGGGALVLLPPVGWDESALSYTRGKSSYWNKEGIAFGKRLVSALVEAADALRRAGARSPVPDWATAPEHSTFVEERLQARLDGLDGEMTALADARRAIQAEREEASVLRWLLFETGKPLRARDSQGPCFARLLGRAVQGCSVRVRRCLHVPGGALPGRG